MPTARIHIPSPLTLFERNDPPVRGKRIPIEVDATLTIDADYYAMPDSEEVLRTGKISVVGGVLWMGRVQLSKPQQADLDQLAAEWLMVPANKDWLFKKCEEHRVKWLETIGR
jgi:hypothetical protein